MKDQIKYNSKTKDNIKNKLSTVEDTLSVNMNSISNLYDSLSALGDNPELSKIIAKVLDIKENKGTVRTNVRELNQKMSMNLEQISDLDSEVSEKFKGW